MPVIVSRCCVPQRRPSGLKAALRVRMSRTQDRVSRINLQAYKLVFALQSRRTTFVHLALRAAYASAMYTSQVPLGLKAVQSNSPRTAGRKKSVRDPHSENLNTGKRTVCHCKIDLSYQVLDLELSPSPKEKIRYRKAPSDRVSLPWSSDLIRALLITGCV